MEVNNLLKTNELIMMRKAFDFQDLFLYLSTLIGG
jgi:hypothetical protein